MYLGESNQSQGADSADFVYSDRLHGHMEHTAVYTVPLEHQESLAQGQASTDQVAPCGPLRLGPLEWSLCTHHPSLYVFLTSFQEEQQMLVKQQEARCAPTSTVCSACVSSTL